MTIEQIISNGVKIEIASPVIGRADVKLTYTFNDGFFIFVVGQLPIASQINDYYIFIDVIRTLYEALMNSVRKRLDADTKVCQHQMIRTTIDGIEIETCSKCTGVMKKLPVRVVNLHFN